MSRAEKLLAAMRANPLGWTMTDVERACRIGGLSCLAPTGGGSHYKISHPGLPDILTVPFKRPIKPVYIKLLIAMIDAAEKS